MAKKIKVHGLFATNKPRGMSCAKVLELIDKVSRAHAASTRIEMTRRKVVKLGCGGALDDIAAGVLVVGVNDGAKELKRFTKCDKTYEVTTMLGFQSDALDVRGQHAEKKPLPSGLEEKLRAILPKFVGVIRQLPPKYTAVNIDEGTRLHEYGRKQIEVTRPSEPRFVRIDRLELLDYTTRHNYKPIMRKREDSDDVDAISDESKALVSSKSPSESPYPIFKLKVECGGGAFIRSLIRDIGKQLDTPVSLVDLVRTREAEFVLGENTMRFEDLDDFDNIYKAINDHIRLIRKLDYGDFKL
ncbi:5477_t:CDS:2 [Paraglomus occultum]|uniref:tRNA pseudouridine(55) synthase n=1 Tax=Paraglomus occultum TaxID=144539 RepID=A0A9N8WPG2_9GLOM|nr:5477_t:CDS:2 [Paraglomus occultum]